MIAKRQRLMALIGAALLGCAAIAALNWVLTKSLPYEGPVLSIVEYPPAETRTHVHGRRSRAEQRTVTIRGLVLSGYERPIFDGRALLRSPAAHEEAPEVYAECNLADGLYELTISQGRSCLLRIECGKWGAISIGPRRYYSDCFIKVVYRKEAVMEGELRANGEILKAVTTQNPRLSVHGPLDEQEATFDPKSILIQRSDADPSQFVVPGLGPGVWRLSGEFSGRPIMQLLSIKVNGEKQRVVIDLNDVASRASAQTPLLRGKAIVGVDRAPLCHARLWGRLHGKHGITSLSSEVYTDSVGAFEISADGIDEGVVVRLFRDKELPGAEVTYGVPEADGSYRFIFDDPRRRTARVVNRQGRPVMLAAIGLANRHDSRRRYWKRTNELGEFLITDVPLGEYSASILCGTVVVDIADPLFVEAGDIVLVAPIDRCFGLVVVDGHGRAVWDYCARMVVPGTGGEPAEEAWIAKTMQVVETGDDEILKAASLGRCISSPLEKDFFVEVLSPSAGFKKIWVRSDDTGDSLLLTVVLDAKPEVKEVCVVDQSGNPVEDATFEIPAYSAEVRRHWKLMVREFPELDGGDAGSSLLQVTRTSGTGCFLVRLYAGEGSLVRVSSKKSGSAVVQADELARGGVAILE